MKHVHDTWYVLEDGSKADPNDVTPDDSGVLRNKGGVAVAMRGSVPHTSGVGPVSAKLVDDGKKAAKPKDREIKAGDDGSNKYETR
jgi:hypothetical protein